MLLLTDLHLDRDARSPLAKGLIGNARWKRLVSTVPVLPQQFFARRGLPLGQRKAAA